MKIFIVVLAFTLLCIISFVNGFFGEMGRDTAVICGF